MNRNTLQYHQVKRIWLVLPFCLFTFLPLTAQTYTQRIQQQGNGRASVTIHQSDSIDQLVNSELLGNRGSSKPAAPTPNTTGPARTTSTTSTSNTTSPTTPADQTNLTNPQDEQQQPRATYRTTGYRVQAFAGGNSRADRQKAERIRNSIKASYPNVAVYVHFFSPRWICRVGNYKTYEEAHQMMTNLKNMGYSECTIVKGKITVAY